jgi:hypothetical protein
MACLCVRRCTARSDRIRLQTGNTKVLNAHRRRAHTDGGSAGAIGYRTCAPQQVLRAAPLHKRPHGRPYLHIRILEHITNSHWKRELHIASASSINRRSLKRCEQLPWQALNATTSVVEKCAPGKSMGEGDSQRRVTLQEPSQCRHLVEKTTLHSRLLRRRCVCNTSRRLAWVHVGKAGCVALARDWAVPRSDKHRQSKLFNGLPVGSDRVVVVPPLCRAVVPTITKGAVANSLMFRRALWV